MNERTKGDDQVIPKLLTDCCDGAYPEDLARPWIAGDGWVYATDSRILARWPSDRLSIDEAVAHRIDGRRVPAVVAKLFADAQAQPGEPFAIPETLPERLVVCDECNGSGTVECDLGHDHDCDECDDYRMEKNREPVEVGPAKFAAWYLHLLRDAGFTTLNVAAPNDPATAEHDGIEVLLMPYATEGE